MASSSHSRLVTFRGGFVASLEVVERLLTIEARGARFVPVGGRFKVDPLSTLTPEDTTFLKAHRDEARRVLAYQPTTATSSSTGRVHSRPASQTASHRR